MKYSTCFHASVDGARLISPVWWLEWCNINID